MEVLKKEQIHYTELISNTKYILESENDLLSGTFKSHRGDLCNFNSKNCGWSVYKNRIFYKVILQKQQIQEAMELRALIMILQSLIPMWSVNYLK